MPETWQTFYLMVGSSSAGLIGLLFVVMTLTSEVEPSRAMLGSRVYITPTVYHFAVLVLIGAVAVMPDVPAQIMAAVIVVPAATGFVVALVSLTRMLRGLPRAADASDFFFYAILPAVAYLWLIGSAAALWSGVAFAAFAIAGGAVALLLVGIRDAWDLATWLAHHRQG